MHVWTMSLLKIYMILNICTLNLSHANEIVEQMKKGRSKVEPVW